MASEVKAGTPCLLALLPPDAILRVWDAIHTETRRSLWVVSKDVRAAFAPAIEFLLLKIQPNEEHQVIPVYPSSRGLHPDVQPKELEIRGGEQTNVEASHVHVVLQHTRRLTDLQISKVRAIFGLTWMPAGQQVCIAH
jgi:hypothetical protein